MKTIFIPMQFRCRRLKLRKTLKDVGEDTGLSISFLSDIEQGRTLPSIKTLLALIDYYEMDIYQPFGRFEEVDR